MLKIEEEIIYLTRGDDAVLDVSMANLEGTAYEMQPEDKLILTVREKPEENSAPLFIAESQPGIARLEIRSADTDKTDPGQYSADIQLTYADGRRATIWPTDFGSNRIKGRNMKNFNVASEVTI
jgi:hypothetical protein